MRGSLDDERRRRERLVAPNRRGACNPATPILFRQSRPVLSSRHGLSRSSASFVAAGRKVHLSVGQGSPGRLG
jgi:hypothetical protein